MSDRFSIPRRMSPYAMSGFGFAMVFFIFCFRGVNPGVICAGVMSDYFLRIVKASMVPAVIADLIPSMDFALTKTLIA